MCGNWLIKRGYQKMIIHWEPKQNVDNGQSESGCVPWQQANNALS